MRNLSLKNAKTLLVFALFKNSIITNSSVSTEEQARIQDGSLVSQRQRLIEYVDGQNRREAGWGQVVDVYCDEGKSAKDMNRPVKMMVFNLINFAQFERKQTAERISANWLSRAKRGLWNGGSIPLGFDRNPKNPGELLPSSTESLQVKEIFLLFLEKGSVRQTCRELSKRGMFSKKFTTAW